MKRSAIVAVLALVLAGACSADSSASSTPSSSVLPNDIPACKELYVAGEKIETDTFGQACTTDDGELLAPLPVKLTCEDDRTLLWNELAWGYLGEPMTLVPEDTARTMPEEQVSECVGTEPGLGDVELEEPS